MRRAQPPPRPGTARLAEAGGLHSSVVRQSHDHGISGRNRIPRAEAARIRSTSPSRGTGHFEGLTDLQGPAIPRLGRPASAVSPQSAAAMVTYARAAGRIGSTRTLMRQLAYGWVWDSSSPRAWV